ncbi:phage-associated protein [Corynebacterium kutscheri]|uniref:Phage-associated protein n=2 Tax=Corynebacterium kutscheri TaxID=35755 RepID=A0AB38VXZ0_9CORY|nr:phage-associated protein [Corynebacterium kutscheri]
MKYKPHNYQQFATNFIETNPQAAIFLGMGMGKPSSPSQPSTTSSPIDMQSQKHSLSPHYESPETHGPTNKKMGPPQKPPNQHHHRKPHHPMKRTQHRRRHLHHQQRKHPLARQRTRQHMAIRHSRHRRTIQLQKSQIETLQSTQNKTPTNPPHHRPHRNLSTQQPRRHLGPIPPHRPRTTARKNLTHYRNRYFLLDKRNGAQIYSYKIRPGADKQIYDLIKDITVSMKTTDYLDLPPLATTTINVHLNPKERTIYNQLCDDMVTTIDTATIDAGTAGTLSNKLQQLSSGDIYTDDGVRHIHNQKLYELADIVEQASGNTILVAYWFKHELERLEAKFPQGKELSTSQDMDDWCEQKIPIGFIHPASAGHGLNLQTGGHIMVWLTTPWSLELYEQTNARLFRQGQTQPVSIIHINATNTIDDDVMAALERKDITQSALINAVKAQLGKDAP